MTGRGPGPAPDETAGPGSLEAAQLERRAAVAWRTGVVTLVVANVVFVYGLSRFVGRDVAGLCAQRGQPYRPDETSSGGSLSAFPLSMPCNADYDLVPVWMLPLTAIGTALAVAALAYFLLLRRRQAALWAASAEETS